MSYTLTDLELADRQVAQGTRHVEQQRAIVRGLEARGHDSEEAKKLLVMFETTLQNHRRYQDAIRLGVGHE